MSFEYISTAGFMPRDVRTQRNPYLPRQRQRPYLEQNHDQRRT